MVDRSSVICAVSVVTALCVCTEVEPSSLYCQQLHLAYEKNGPDRTISVYGHERSLTVHWDGSPTSRVAAALLSAVLRHGLRYRLRMARQPSGLCELLEEREKVISGGNLEYGLIVAPSITWNESATIKCGTEGIQSDRVQVLGSGAAPISLQPLPWDPTPNTDTNQTVRVADVSLIRKFAPSILEVFGRFFIKSSYIEEVLNFERKHHSDIIEAACAWTLKNTDVFDRWIKVKRIRFYEVGIFLCLDDPDNSHYVNILNLLSETFSNQESPYIQIALRFKVNTTLRILNVNCADEYSLMRKFIERAQSVYYPRLIGVVASGTGSRAAANVASALDTALVLYDVPAEIGDGPVRRGARSATGTLQQLSLAFQYFFATCQWTRLSIISEETKLAADFVTFLKADKNLTVLDVSVKTGVETALNTLYKKDARVIFINGNTDVAISVLCAAYKLGKLSDASYVWILREWRPQVLTCENSTIQNNNFVHFTISFWWRGGGMRNVVPKKLQKFWGKTAWPLRTAPLLDATTMLIQGFYNLLQNRSHCLDDLHSPDCNRAFWASYDPEPPQGITQQLSLNQQTLSDPNIYIYKWYGKHYQLEAVWQIYKDRLKVLHQPQKFYSGPMPSDGRRSCWTTKTGDSFAPHCHDTVWFTALAAILIAVPATIVARRARREQIARRDRELTARLLTRGRRASAALAAHLVDRATLQLGRVLGEGRFGRVHLGVLRPPGKQPLVVAAKALREEATQAEEREFLNEAVTLASLKYIHVVRLIGVCATGGPPLVLMEHAFFGDLLEYLRERRHLVGGHGGMSAEAEQVSAPALTRLAHQAAIALDYLRQQRLVHRDVRASNCLVDARRSLKLADFGLARKMESGATGGDEEYLGRRRGLLPVLWMAPESLQRGVFTAASDAWALGVLLLELATLGERPYGCWPPERVIRSVCAGGYPPLPTDITPDLTRLLLQCWRRVPAERVSAAELARELTRSPAALRPTTEPLVAGHDYSCSAGDGCRQREPLQQSLRGN